MSKKFFQLSFGVEEGHNFIQENCIDGICFFISYLGGGVHFLVDASSKLMATHLIIKKQSLKCI